MESKKNKYRLLLENLPDAFAYCRVVTDAAGKPVDYFFLHTSDAFSAMTGLPRQEIIGKKVTEIYSSPDYSSCNWIDTFGKVALTGEKTCFEQYCEPKNRWYEITVYSEEHGYFAVIFRDITDYRKNERALRESETRYRRLIENLNEVIYILDENAKIIYVSPNVEQLSGYTPSELTGKCFTTFVHPEDSAGRMEQFLKILSGVNKATEYRFLTKTGDAAWVRTSARPIMKKGQIVGIQGVLMDITDLKQTEEKIRHLGFHDSLTGLYNRYFLQEEMQRLDTKRQLPISIVMADVNGLKLINDTFGHSAGDEMLRFIAKLLRESCRKEDLIARWGGDEFIILLPQTTLKEAEHVCQRITEHCRKTVMDGFPISIALGVARKNNTQKSLADILQEAEKAMYTQKIAEFRNTRNAVLEALRKTLTEKSFETETHINRMHNMALLVGKKLGLPESELDRLAALVTLHDIGIIKIPKELITKKAALSKKEREMIREHPEIGCRIARASEVYAHVAEEILAHHERWDGSGYPRRLKGKEIPLLARITAIVDAYEVMTGGRPYQKAIPPEDALAELKRCAGTHFDPELVDVFISISQESPGL